MSDDDEIREFHAKARRRRRVLYAVAVIVVVGAAAFAVWVSATSGSSWGYPDAPVRTVGVGALMVFFIGIFGYRMRKDR
jgi:VIT1/CCC1 family predicted Fe2+/Mn2+ transporter